MQAVGLRAKALEQQAAAAAEELRRQQEEAARLREQARVEAELWEAQRRHADALHAAALAARQRQADAEAERRRATEVAEAERRRLEAQWVSGGGGFAGGGHGPPCGSWADSHDGNLVASSQALREAEAQQAQRLRATVEMQNRRHAFVQYDRADLTAKLRLEQRRSADQKAEVLRLREEEREEVRARLEATNREAKHAAALLSAIEAAVIEAQDLWERHLGREGKGE